MILTTRKRLLFRVLLVAATCMTPVYPAIRNVSCPEGDRSQEEASFRQLCQILGPRCESSPFLSPPLSSSLTNTTHFTINFNFSEINTSQYLPEPPPILWSTSPQDYFDSLQQRFDEMLADPGYAALRWEMNALGNTRGSTTATNPSLQQFQIMRQIQEQKQHLASLEIDMKRLRRWIQQDRFRDTPGPIIDALQNLRQGLDQALAVVVSFFPGPAMTALLTTIRDVLHQILYLTIILVLVLAYPVIFLLVTIQSLQDQLGFPVFFFLELVLQVLYWVLESLYLILYCYYSQKTTPRCGCVKPDACIEASFHCLFQRFAVASMAILREGGALLSNNTLM